ncbi:MAG TPA: peptide deformylase, partial [Bradyrhizobium sp.]|nr:peptide deformylase [Bradyrhizobium sp.]
MALKEIIVLPDKRLRLVSKPVDKVTPEIRKLVDDMFETMYDAPGIGLAAIQVAEPLRLITMDLAKKSEEGETKREPRVFINPEILSSSEEQSVYEEGCLSIPEYYEEVERPAKVRVRYTDLEGKVHEEEAEGLFATCIQHEIDHLN